MNVHPKVAASATVGAILTVILAVLSAAGTALPAHAALIGLITTVVSAVAGYFKSA